MLCQASPNVYRPKEGVMGTTLSTNMRVGNRPMTSQEADAARAKEEQHRYSEDVDLVTPDGEFNRGIGDLLNCLLD